MKMLLEQGVVVRAEKVRASDFAHRWVEDILYFEGPILSLLKASTSQDYFYYWLGFRRSANQWLAVDVSRSEIEEYKEKETSLLQIIEGKEVVHIVSTDKERKVTSAIKVNVADLPESYLPPPTSFFDPELCTTPQKKMLEEPGAYCINVDGAWFLEDLVEIPRVYNQLYTFIYTLRHLYKRSVRGNASDIFKRYPWRGGYSAVNFYSQLNQVIPSLHEPKVHAIQYASPGRIELELTVDTSKGVKRCINAAAKNAEFLRELSRDVKSHLRDEGLSKRKGNIEQLRIPKKSRSFLTKKSKEIANALALGPYIEDIRQMAGNELLTVRIMLSFYRRIKKFSDYQSQRKISFD